MSRRFRLVFWSERLFLQHFTVKKRAIKTIWTIQRARRNWPERISVLLHKTNTWILAKSLPGRRIFLSTLRPACRVLRDLWNFNSVWEEHKPVQQPRELQRGDFCGMCSLHAEDDGGPQGVMSGTNPSCLVPFKGPIPRIDCFPSPF